MSSGFVAQGSFWFLNSKYYFSNKFLSRISFEISNFLTASINFWKKSQCSWITPIYSDFSKIWCWKIPFSCVTTSFLDMLRLEKTVCFESADWNSNIWVHRPFFCQLKVFPVIDHVRTVKNPARCFSARSKSIPSKRINS